MFRSEPDALAEASMYRFLSPLNSNQRSCKMPLCADIRIETERLLLRSFCYEGCSRWFQIMSSPRVTRYWTIFMAKYTTSEGRYYSGYVYGA